MGNLNDVFVFADIDDVSLDRHQDAVTLVVTERATGEGRVVTGDDLDDAVEQTLRWLDGRIAERDAADANWDALDTLESDAWDRGRLAGLREAQLNAEIEALLPSVPETLPEPAVVDPVTANAAEPFTLTEGTVLTLILPVTIARA